MVKVEKVTLIGNPSRPRNNEAIIVTRANGDRLRFEFDYDETNIYVYTSVWPTSRPNGIGPAEYLPVRRYSRTRGA